MTSQIPNMCNAQNIRVCLRFRPVNKIETKSANHKIVAKVSNDCKMVEISGGRKKKNFTFDHVFPANSTQHTVFNYTGLPLTEAVLSGYNCTLFAYGQTGSGKTYSMEGIINDIKNEGLIPRMVRSIFDRILDDNNEDNNLIEYTLRVSFVEIYNEKLRDLLQPHGPPLKIRDQQKGIAKGVYIENVHSPFVASPEDVFDHLSSGHVNRSVASTRMNEHSSRSHAVFMLQIDQRNTETGSSKMSKLMMVDLAGSEKVRKTNATGQTLKEAQQINKSLMVLGLVINSLVENKKHIPYRDSKLTRLLSDALGGNSKTCLLVTASPSKYNREETIGTLRFGQRAKSIKNSAKINQELSVAEYKKLLEKHKKREEILKQQIKSLQIQLNGMKIVCQEHNIDLRSVLKNVNHKQSGTQAMVMIPNNSSTESNANLQQIQALKDGLEKEQALRLKMSEEFERMKEELEDAKQDLATQGDFYADERAEIQQITQQLTDAEQKIVQLTYSVKSSNTKLHTIQQDILREKEDRADDKERYELELHSKDNKILELNEKYEQMLKQIKESSSNSNTSAADVAVNIHKEGEKSLIFAGGLDNQGFAKLVTTARRLEQRTEALTLENDKLRSKLKAYKRRDEVNKQLRENWNKQLEQMEQAVIVANEIYHRERARHEEELAQKDIEITKLRQFLLSFTNRQQQYIRNRQERHMQNGTTVIHDQGVMSISSPRYDVNAPGARKSKIVVPKVIKAGAHKIGKFSSHRSSGRNNNNNRNQGMRVLIGEESKKDY